MLRVAFVLCAALVAGGASAETKVNNNWVGIFPNPSCNVSTAMDKLRVRLAKEPIPSGDGFIPWPGVLGYWSESSRGAYFRVAEEKVPGYEFGLVRVEIRSVCDNSVLALGTKMIRDADWESDYMVVALRNYRLSVKKRSRLVAAFEVHDAHQKTCGLNLQMLEIDEYGQVSSTDYFRVVRP
jgi:hypothetical protein